MDREAVFLVAIKSVFRSNGIGSICSLIIGSFSGQSAACF